MRKTFEAIFSEDKVLNVSAFLAVAGALVYGIYCIPQGALIEVISDFFLMLVSVCLWSSCRTHEKNPQKLLLGALTASLVMRQIITFYINMLIVQLTGFQPIDIVAVVKFAVIVILFFNNLAIVSDHHGGNDKTVFNQVITIIWIVLCLTGVIISIATGDYMVCVAQLASLGQVALVVCIETKLDVYKDIRDQKTSDSEWEEVTKQNVKEDVFGK